MTHPLTPCMQEAMRLAEQGRWTTAPNPVVGAVLVRDGIIVARGWHKEYGGDHAEVVCLADATAQGINPAECTLVVTLEPCNHQGKTPPCTEAILAAGIRHVVIGLEDPNPKAAGGIARLQEAGIHVECGLCADEIRESLTDFFLWQQTSRPYVILKLATTLDGRIATRTNHSQWVTGEESLQAVHALRAKVGMAGGAVLVGGNTLYADNPLLTARLGEAIRQPLAAAITSRVPTPEALALLKERPSETVLFTTASGTATPKAAALREKGVRVFGVGQWKSSGKQDILQVLEHLRTEEGCPYVLCEGGGQLGLSLLEANLVDEFHLFIAPKVLGDNEAHPLFNGRSPLDMNEAIGLRFVHMERSGEDCHLILRRKD